MEIVAWLKQKVITLFIESCLVQTQYKTKCTCLVFSVFGRPWGSARAQNSDYGWQKWHQVNKWPTRNDKRHLIQLWKLLSLSSEKRARHLSKPIIAWLPVRNPAGKALACLQTRMEIDGDEGARVGLKCHVSRAVIPQSDRMFLWGGGGRWRRLVG